MSEITRYSSRTQRLDKVFLSEKLQGAKSYRRIAGYFKSSIFELVGEELSELDEIKIVCNSELDPRDIQISKSVRETALKEKFNEGSPGLDAALDRDRYKKLHELLTKGNLEIRVVARDTTFLHGKAGVIESRDGTKTSFLGSVNETRNAFSSNYEILWEDPSPEGVAWVEEEFQALWEQSHALPDAIINEIERIAKRVEVHFDELSPEQIPGAALVESPIYRSGEQLQPWQRSFVTRALEHRETYGKARLLLADEVGLGKTLSLATAAMVTALLDDGPVLILCPATLKLQWQIELKDRLGIPSAVWLSNKKSWQDHNEYVIKTKTADAIRHCPFQIAIVSTGLINQDTKEKEILGSLRYGTVILDEAHKARSQGGYSSATPPTPNKLLSFMKEIAPRTKNLLLGTGTPIQVDVGELWDLLAILNQGAEFVLGDMYSSWPYYRSVLPFIQGTSTASSAKELWELIRDPLPPSSEGSLVSRVRRDLDIPETSFLLDRIYEDLNLSSQSALEDTSHTDYLKEHNPLTRHIVLRRRADLEDKGLLEKVAVEIHPPKEVGSTQYLGLRLVGKGLLTNEPFRIAYEAAEEFSKLYGARTKSRGLAKTLLLQRICSSFAAGRSTAQKILDKQEIDDDETDTSGYEDDELTPTEREYLVLIVDELSAAQDQDIKLDAVKYFLHQHRIDGKTWLEHGCIIFSQYYDTAYWVAAKVSRDSPSEPIGVYAGAGRSGIFLDGAFTVTRREDIKDSVKDRRIRLVVATDAASEGLNLQTLGTLINVDLPWNPARLEQRLGRIKRYGQLRECVDMANLVYHETQDERIFEAISRRLKDKYDIFGGLPSTIEDEWIDGEEALEGEMDRYINLRDKVKDVFQLRPEDVHEHWNRWENVERVLASQDIITKLGKAW